MAVHLSFLHAKQLLMKLLFENCKHVQIYCWDWCQPTITRLDVSNHAYQSLYALGFGLRNEFIHTSTKQDPQLWKYGNVLFPTNKTRMWNWKILHNRQTEEKWLLECWWVFSHCNTEFEAMGCFHHFCPSQELRPSLTEGDIQRGSKKRELDALRRHYRQQKCYKAIGMWKCDRWRLCKTTNIVKQHIQEHFPYRRSFVAGQLVGEIKTGKINGYVQCDIEVAEKFR